VGQDAARDFYAKTLQCSSDYVTLAATEGTQIITALQALAGPGGFPLLFGELTGLSGVVDCTSVTEMALAIDRFGHLNLGVDLFEADMTPGSVEWGLPAGRPSGALIGGHSILAFDYTGLAPRDHLRLASWGQWYWATWEWVLSRVREAHAMIFRQLAGPDGIFWNGLSADDLVEHLNG
jgi:hypothetical protein